jgi:hypothetical protein
MAPRRVFLSRVMAAALMGAGVGSLRAAPMEAAGQLEGVQAALLRGGTAEEASGSAASALDGAAKLPASSPAAAGRLDGAASAAPPSFSPAAHLRPPMKGDIPAPPASPAPRKTVSGAKVGFMVGYSLVESVAIVASALPAVGKAVSGFLAVVLLLPALVMGGLGALIGSLFRAS